MKKTLRTTVSLLLTLCMALSLGGVSALADGEPSTIDAPVAVSTDNSGTVTVTVGGSPAATLPSGATEPVTGGAVTITPAAGETPATVEIAANIATTGSNSDGVAALDSTVTVGGSVSTTGEHSYGVVTSDSTVTVGGSISTDGNSSHGVYAYNDSTVEVTGDVSTEKGNSHGVFAKDSTVTVIKDADGKGGDVSTKGNDSDGVYAANSKVTVEGGVSTEKGNSTGVEAKNSSTVTVGGGVSTEGEDSDGVIAANGSTVKVTGGVSTTGYSSNGIKATNSTVTVIKDADGNGGDVSTTGIGSDGVVAYNNSTVTVEGGVSTTGDNSYGVYTLGNSTVEVGGDVTGTETGIQVVIGSRDTAGSTIVVEGTVSATGDNGQAIKLQVPDDATLDTVKEALPEIIVQSIDSDADYVVCTGASNDNNAAIAAAVRESIKYIVDVESKKENGRASTVTVDLVKYGTSEAADTYETADGKILAVATATTQLKLGVDQTKGALIGVAVTDANGAQTELEKNKDGDWVITVPAGGFKDGFKITATVREKQTWFGPLWPSFGGETYTEVVQKRDPLSVEGDKLLIDLTETESVTLTAAALRGYRDSGVKTVEILVKNGSFVVEMGDLLNALGSAANVAFTSHGETLDISADGASLATLVLGAGA